MKSMRDKIWSAALQCIKVRHRSRYELNKKLTEKYPDETGLIDEILDEMQTVQLLNDRRYTEQLIHHLTLRPIGRFKLMNECRKRGLEEGLVQDLLVDTDYNEEEMAQLAFDQKNKTLHETDPRKRKQKMMNFLMNRGFTNAVIYKVMNK